MKRFTNKTFTRYLLAFVSLLLGTNVAIAQTGEDVAAVKMTWVDFDNPDTSKGAVETAQAGYNKISNGEVGFVNTGWGCNWITYLQVDASEVPGTITKATLTFEGSGSTDSKRTTGWGVGYNGSVWSADMTYNTADKSITVIGSEQWTTTKSATVFESFEFDITEALKNAEGKVATVLVYETAAAGGYIKNPTVTVNYTTATTYAVTFVETNDVAATVTLNGSDVTKGTSLPNGTYEFKATAAGYKDYTGEFTVAGADKVVEFTMTEKAIYNYTVKGVDGEGNDLGVVAAGTGYEGENVTYYYPEFVQNGTTLYKKNHNSSNPYWGATGLLDADNKEFTVTYDNGTIENVIFYKEAEEMEGFTAKTTNNAPIRCSNGIGGIVEGEVALVTVTAGKYKIFGQVWGTTGLTAGVKAGETAVWELESTGSLAEHTSDEFELTETTTLYVYTTGGNDNHMLDLIYIISEDGAVDEVVEEPSLAPGDYSVTYALKEGETHTAGETVEVNVEDITVATLTFGFEGGAAFKAANADNKLKENGFVAYTEGNGENGKPTEGTVYIINPKYDGQIEVGVVLNADKAFYVLEDGVSLADYDGIKVSVKYYGTYAFNVNAGKEYKVYCAGSKLGFYGFNYKFTVPDSEEEVIYGDATIEGEWKVTTDWHYAGESSLGQQTDVYTATLDGNVVTFTNEYGEKFVAEFTAENTLTFKLAAVGAPATYTETQNPFVDGTKVTDAGIDPENFVFESFNATYDPEKGTITFPEGAGLALGFANAAGEFSYYQDAFDFVSATKVGGEEPTPEVIARRWDFTAWSEATVANLIADAAESYTEGWSDIEKNGDTEPTATSKDNCFWSINTPDEIGGLSANKVLIDELKGLKFGANVNNRGLAIAVNYPVALSTYEGPAYLWLGGANKQFFTIPAVKAGSTIKMGVESHKTTDARGVDLLVNGTSIGKFEPKTYEEHTWTVTADGAVNVVVDNTNGCHIYFIEVEQDQEALMTITKADLETVIEAVNAIENFSIYTEESVAALGEALAAASNLAANATIDEIAEATYALLNAKAALELTEVPEPVVMTYTVNEVAGDIVFRTTEGEALEGTSVKVPYRLYNVDENGKLYKKGATSKEYNYSFTLTAEGQVENIEYAATEVENVVFIAEGEDIEGLTPITTGNAAIRSSNSAAGHASEDTEIVTIASGTYTVHVVMYDGKKGGGETFTFKAGEQEFELVAGENFSEKEFELTLNEATALILGANTATDKGLDAIYIVKTGDITTGINTVGAQSENGAVYNLQGQKVMKTQKGLYIVNGKKVVVK